MAPLPTPRLLILDDSSLDLRQWSRLFAELGYGVSIGEAGDDFKTRDELRDLIARIRPDFLLTDFAMQGFNGFIVLGAAQEAVPGLPVALHAARLEELERFAGKTRDQLAAPGLFLAVAEKGQIKEIDKALRNHLQSAQKESAMTQTPNTPNAGMNPDDVSRIIMLLYGKMDHGGPFWCYVAIKPSQFDAFKAAEKAGQIDLYNFDAYGEVIVSAEGQTPPEEVTLKVAELYGADASTFFQPIDPMAEINRKIDELKSQQGE